LERNGQNLQHFSRELSRYFRNLLVARIAGAETRLVAASPAQRQKLVDIASRFSEEDLTRYLQLALDVFKELQFSLQPRFHLEIGLVRMVQAGRLLSIEQALADLGGAAPRPVAPALSPKSPAAAPPPPPPVRQAPPPRTGPSPFELDQAQKTVRPPEPKASAEAAPAAPLRPPVPQAAVAAVAIEEPAQPPQPPSPPAAESPSGDWRQKLHTALMELGLPFTADALENSRVAEVNGELQITTTRANKLAM